MVNLGTYVSPIGNVIIATKNGNVVGLWFENQKYFLASINEETVENNQDEAILKVKDWLDRYFKGEGPSIKELSLCPTGSTFQLMVWDILKEIPYGKTVTYQDIACRIAKKKQLKRMSSQAVGGAVGHNPISIIIPCHRVLGSHGNLTGYAGGIDKKIYLLKNEKIDMTKFYIKKKGDLNE